MPSVVRTSLGYDAANRSVAVLDGSARTRIEAAGPDRAKVLHNLTTNDVKRLAAGRGVEAFLTSGQGRTLALLTIHAEADRLLVRADPGSAAAILGHVGKYGLFDDATFEEITAGTAEWHACGPEVGPLADRLGLTLPAGDLSIAAATIAGLPVRLIVESPSGRPGLSVISAAADADAVGAAIRRGVADLGGEALDAEAWEALRIEAGTPVFGRDVTAANLPQEIGRDARAISFVKGCYLGQETVARLDALGHVNKILFGAVVEPGRTPPAPGTSIQAEGKDVGVVTSSAESPGWSRGVVLGIAKVTHVAPGSTLVAATADGPVTLVVRRWPMISGAVGP